MQINWDKLSIYYKCNFYFFFSPSFFLKIDLDEFAVRCGNLPVGVGKPELMMFIGEADVFPKSINIKSKKKTGPGEKKHVFK